MKHDYVTAKDCRCDNPMFCDICEGGLALCRTCGGAEGWLTTDCPGCFVPYEVGQRVGAKELDYRDGAWVELGGGAWRRGGGEGGRGGGVAGEEGGGLEMRPYYDQDGITLYHGDARSVLPSLPAGSVELVLTDPPYNIGSPQRVSGLLSADRRLVGGDFGTFDKGAITPAEWFPLVDRLLAPGGVVLSFYGSRGMANLLTASELFEAIQDFHWCKANPPVPMRSVGFSWGVESGYAFRRKGERHKPNLSSGVSPNWFNAPICAGAERTEHPTQKPEVVMAWLARSWSFPGQTILDPFAGSGTTLRVAKDHGCKAVGVEADERYCELAARRLSQSVFDWGGEPIAAVSEAQP